MMKKASFSNSHWVGSEVFVVHIICGDAQKLSASSLHELCLSGLALLFLSPSYSWCQCQAVHAPSTSSVAEVFDHFSRPLDD